ncbi:hypothetical protein C1645_815809 [Glomus cerebriforme]|uniref:Uncharacterized protein n=1 Tax=Glomus cerebriforme TaxID=658196 RepID=A0A397TI04_9GLOM|nr:hypothetical protein C1645_815809 [Glomus cerebriforme]
MAGTTIAFMICSIIYSLIKLFTRKSCWSSELFCRFTKCESDKIKVVYKYKIHNEITGYEVSEHNEFYLQAAVASTDQQGDECITTKIPSVFCEDDNELVCNYDGSEEELISDDDNSCSAEDLQTEEEIDISPFVVNCPADFEANKFKPSVKKYFYFVEVDDLKINNNYEIHTDKKIKKPKKLPSSKKSPLFDWYGKDIKIRPCPEQYKKPWWTRVDPSKY